MANQAAAPLDFSRVRVLFPDHHGLARGKYLPIRSAAEGTHHSITLFALDFDRTMVPAPGAMLLEGNPDMKVTFDMEDVRPGWEHGTGSSSATSRSPTSRWPSRPATC